MSPAGRPPLAGKPKEERLEIRFTDDEKREVDAAAARSGKPLATWARDSLLELARAAKKPAKGRK